MALEGIGLAASIVGLIAAGAKFVPWLLDVTKKVQDAPKTVVAVMRELNDINLILEGINAFMVIEEKNVPPDRRSLISVDRIAITLTGFVITYSELEQHVDFVKGGEGMSFFDRGKWILKEKDILDVIRRLQNHKLSLSTVLGIINASSQRRAMKLMVELHQSTERAFQQHRALVSQIERHRENGTFSIHGSAATISHSIHGDGRSTNDAATITRSIATANTRRSVSSLAFNINLPKRRRPLFGYEEDLAASWVYKRSGFNLSVSSLWSRGSSNRGTALSTLSQLTWGDVSNISVFNLPISGAEIYNGYHYFVADDGISNFSEHSNDTATQQTLHSKRPKQIPIVPPDTISDNEDLGASQGNLSSQLSRETVMLPCKCLKTCRQAIHQLPDRPKGVFIKLERAPAQLVDYLAPKPISSIAPPSASKEAEAETQQPGEQFLTTAVLWGPLGIGKTRFALEYAYSLKDETGISQIMEENLSDTPPNLPTTGTRPAYKYIIWVDAKTESFESSFRAALIEFGQSLESACDYLPWLIIFDGLDDYERIRDYWSNSARCRGSILITTRDPRPFLDLKWDICDEKEVVNTDVVRPGSDLIGNYICQQFVGLSARAAIELLKAQLKATPSDFDIDSNSFEVAMAIGSYPILIEAAAEGINLGLIDLEEICQLGYVDLQKFHRDYQEARLMGTESMPEISQYERLTTQWTEEIVRPRSLLDKVMLSLMIGLGCSCFLLELFARVQETKVYGVDWLGADRNERLTIALRGLPWALGNYTTSAYALNGTLQRHIIGGMLTHWEEGQMCADVVFEMVSNMITYSSETKISDPKHSKAIRQLFINYLQVPGLPRLSVAHLTTLRKFIRESGVEATEIIGKFLDRLTSLKALTHEPGAADKVGGSPRTVLFELAALCTIYATVTSSRSDWTMAIAGYKDANRYFLDFASKDSISADHQGSDPENSNHTTLGENNIVNRLDENSIWPLERIVISNVKVARCLYLSGHEDEAKIQLSTEISPGLFKDFNNGAQSSHIHGRVVDWDYYDLYRW
ncbi:hypothetical protein TWF718_005090 [Orbilia javanica]|uniref:Uncharacterized protein n=1 Tax=Orbilia javanica TaxID=47235 RepID=A0AAN8RR40_9PEZI